MLKWEKRHPEGFTIGDVMAEAARRIEGRHILFGFVVRWNRLPNSDEIQFFESEREASDFHIQLEKDGWTDAEFIPLYRKCATNPNSRPANSASPPAQDAGHKQEALPTGVDTQECLGGGVPSDNSAAPIPRVVLSYSGARVIDARDKIQIELLGPTMRDGLGHALRNGGWVKGERRIWQREHDVAAIASARDILGRYYGDPI